MGKSSVGIDHQPVKTTNRVLNVLQMLHSYQMQCSASTSQSRSDVNLISCMCQTKPIPAWGNNAGTCRAGLRHSGGKRRVSKSLSANE